jgi:GntR family transcriptional regulator
MNWNDTQLADGPTPLWFQIAERLREAIGQSRFRPGDCLPSETLINQTFGVSRTTARAALDRLEQEGLITRKSGKGSIVLPPRVDQPLNRLAGFSEDMRDRGLVPSYVTRLIRWSTPPAEVLRAIDDAPPGPMIEVERLLLANGRPIGLSHSWLCAERLIAGGVLPTTEALDAGSMYEWMEAHVGVRIARGEEFIEAAIADTTLAALLNYEAGMPILTARRTSRAMDGTPVEHAILRYRADSYRFRIELARP